MTSDTTIAAVMVAMIVVPIIILGIQDARHHSWRPKNKDKRTKLFDIYRVTSGAGAIFVTLCIATTYDYFGKVSGITNDWGCALPI